jgi:uncharacterized protein (DUF58 family)
MALTVDGVLPDAQRSVRSLELAITKRLEGMLHGDHRGVLPGPGWESGDGRPYQVGDDVRRIDWSLTARMNEVHVRDTIADHELETWVVIDGSASLDFGTDQWEKRDLAIAVAATFGFLSCKGASRFGVVVAEPSGPKVFPALSGIDHVRRTLRELQLRPRPASPTGPIDGHVDLGSAIERIARIGRRPGLVVLVSDLLSDPDATASWVRTLRAHSVRAHTVVAELRDRRDDELPAVGLVTLLDPETGRVRDVYTDDPKLRSRFAAAATERRDAMRAAVRRSGAEHLVLATDRDWLTDIVRHHLTKRNPR